MKIKNMVPKLPLNGIELKYGEHNYPEINHKDPDTANQLRIYRDMGKISFTEILDGDKEEDDKKAKAVKDSKKVTNIHAENRKKILAKEKKIKEDAAKAAKDKEDVRSSTGKSASPERKKGSDKGTR